MEESSNDAAQAAVLETLKSRGWCFDELEKVKAITFIHFALADDTDPLTLADSVESELLNSDLRSIGGKSLPDSNQIRKSSCLHGPKVLQISSVRDISLSSMDDVSMNSSSQRRLLKLSLTDGHSEVTAIEYSHIPSIPKDVVPGTKVRLEHKAAVHSGIVCLNSKTITVLGGVVQLLYEEWQVQRKYSVFSLSSLRPSHESETNGPPPFEKLEIGAPSHRFPRKDHSGFTSKGSVPLVVKTVEGTEIKPTNGQQTTDFKAIHIDQDLKTTCPTGKDEENPSSSEIRPKEVAECVPVQNQAASQKLLQKMSEPNKRDWHAKGRRNKGKAKQEEMPVFTLDEWEKSKAGAKTGVKNELSNTSGDEDLAWQLQNQLDMEDPNVPICSSWV
ncbi:uncharacterized protein LOC119997670 isoform X2 [Tripterygium wilfordii]|uniref:uncharacterized protein LOC119997670 isoform X2 n=1 Tax=Tripterygium wilfordii TaxID=458696 RepID=UPI0018F84979|nr:uncharacterized protein LOC119997670 isoform X2 [Tripterygium wilfordii]